jgi:hypothetical protein
MNNHKGLVSKQPLPGRIVSKAEFNHFRLGNSQEKLQHASYFIVKDDKKARTLFALWPNTDLAPANIGSKVQFTGQNKEKLLTIYSP